MVFLRLPKKLDHLLIKWRTAILSHPSVDKLKPVRHLLQLAEKYSKERLEKACERAFNCKLFSYTSVKNILENNLDSQPLEITNASKIIPLPTSIDLQEIQQIIKAIYKMQKKHLKKNLKDCIQLQSMEMP